MRTSGSKRHSSFILVAMQLAIYQIRTSDDNEYWNLVLNKIDVLLASVIQNDSPNGNRSKHSVSNASIPQSASPRH